MFGHKKIFNKITYFCHPETGNMQIKNKVSTHCTNIFEATGKFMLCINTNFLLGNLWFCVILAKKSNNMKKHSFICQKALKTQGMQYMQIISYFISNILPWNTHFTISGKYDHWQKTCNCINFPALVITKGNDPIFICPFLHFSSILTTKSLFTSFCHL